MLERLSYIAPFKAWYVRRRYILSIRRLSYLVYLKGKRKYRKDFSYTMPQTSKIPIDIFIPTLEKDATMLPLAIDYARKNIKHPISNIYIISAGKSTKLRNLARRKNCIFVDERTVLNFDKKTISYHYNGFDKNGWIYKMLLNLNAHTVCSEDNILILDADTLFISPQIFIYKNKPLFNLSDEYHQAYYDANKRILGVRHKISRSFITHYMLFNADVLGSMHAHLEKKWSKIWYEAIIDNLDKSSAMAFADYESYGDYYLYTHPNSRRPFLNYWSNLSGELKDYTPKQLIKIAQKASVFRSVSLHTFKKKTTQEFEE